MAPVATIQRKGPLQGVEFSKVLIFARSDNAEFRMAQKLIISVKICTRRLKSACYVSKSGSGQAQFGNNSQRGWHVISARWNKKAAQRASERKAHEKGSLAATTTTAAQAVCKIEAGGAGRRQLMMCFGGV